VKSSKMKVAGIPEEKARARYPVKVQTDEDCEQAWYALRFEGERQKFMKRTGLSREEVGVVVNTRTKKAYFQWVHAIPKEIRVVTE